MSRRFLEKEFELLHKVKIIRKEKDGLCLQLEWHEEVIIPLSRSYSEEVLQQFSGI